MEIYRKLNIKAEIIQGILIWVQGPWNWENPWHFNEIGNFQILQSCNFRWLNSSAYNLASYKNVKYKRTDELIYKKYNTLD